MISQCYSNKAAVMKKVDDFGMEIEYKYISCI